MAGQRSGEPIRVLLIHRANIEGEDLWVAQCLEHDLVAQGSTVRKAKQAFAMTLASQVRADIERGRKPLEQFKPAPQEYWDMWNDAEDLPYGDAYALVGEEVHPAVHSMPVPELRVY